ERVADVIRKYLGARYGFDGLECTSRETLRMLRAITPPVTALPLIKAFLQQADLVKFARLTPTAEQCVEVLEEARLIVQRTLPVNTPGAPDSAVPPPADPSSTASSSTLSSSEGEAPTSSTTKNVPAGQEDRDE